MKLKKKQLRLLFLMLLSLFAYSTWLTYSSGQMLSNEDFIRFHVIANSDSKADQDLKLLVRDELLKTINTGLAEETMAMAEAGQESVSLTIEESREYIENNLPQIEEAAESVITREGYDYPVEADLAVTFIPEKTYGNLTFPAGNYEALNVTIGEGDGHNWWCVLFPPLCLIGVEPPGEGGNMEDFYKEAILDEKYRALLEETDHPKTLKLKFKVLELLEKE